MMLNDIHMVLRTIYLPPSYDEKLRELAFALKKSKGELIREFIAEGLEKFDTKNRSDKGKEDKSDTEIP